MRAILSFLSSALLSFQVAAATVPNIVFINADDLTRDDLGVYGGQAHTPNIDRLATEGMLFANCFQAAPMCSPTRHNLYTGLYPVRSGAYPNHTFAIEGTKSIVHHLKPLGYRVALSGKRHVAPEAVFPFEYSGKKNPDMEAIDLLFAEAKAEGRPFCLFACSNEPHTPWNKGDRSHYPVEDIKVPPYFVDTPATREGLSKYLAEITYYDEQVGEILNLLKKHDLVEDTIVMVSSEQGSSFPFAKWTLYDAGLETALIVRWPGQVAAGSRSEALVEYTDVVPTLLDAIGVEPVAPLDGKSFLPVLRGEAAEHKDYVFGIMTTRGIINGSDSFGIRSVRSKTHRLIVNLTPETKFTNACTESPEFLSWVRRAENGKKRAARLVAQYQHRPATELYRVDGSWHNFENLAADAELKEVKKKLQDELHSWMADQGDLGQDTELAAYDHQVRGRKEKGKAEKNPPTE